MKHNHEKKIEFVGYMSGDHECFCLCKVPFEDWVKKQNELHKIPLKDSKNFWKWYNESEALTLYPSLFFPKECRSGKWKFNIKVTAQKILGGGETDK